MLDAFPNKDYALTRKKEIKNSLKHHQLISLFYDVKSIFEELSLTMEIEESINEEFDVQNEKVTTPKNIKKIKFPNVFRGFRKGTLG